MTGIPPPTTLLAAANKFLATATNLVKLIEKNIDAGFRISKKVRLQRDLQNIQSLLRHFPQLMYFNGVFITEFSKEHVRTPEEIDSLTDSRDIPAVEEFQKTLDHLNEIFDRFAPHIRGLTADMVVMWKEGIAFRRMILSDYASGKFDSVSRDDISATRERFRELYPLEKKLAEIEKKLEAKLH